MTYKLLIVDDEMANLRLLERLFRHDYYCLTASSGEEAIKLLEQHDVATIITDQRMPQLTGIELLKRTAELRPHMVRILLTGYTDMEALVEAINCGLVYMYVTKPWNNDDLKLRVSRAIEHYLNNKKRHALEVGNARLESRIGMLKTGFVRSFAQALKTRDVSLHDHSTRVSHCAARIAKQIGLDEKSCAQIGAAAMLHDIDSLCYPGEPTCGHASSNHSRLAKPNWGGLPIFALLPEFSEVADVLRFQYENFDGSGTPRGLIGDQIPLGSRLIAIAAQYDLLRTATTPLTHEQTIEMLLNQAGRHLDAQLVQTLRQLTADEIQPSVKLNGGPYFPNLTAHSIN